MADIIQFPVHDDDVDAIFERATQQIAIVATEDGQMAMNVECDSAEEAIQLLEEALEILREGDFDDDKT